MLYTNKNDKYIINPKGKEHGSKGGRPKKTPKGINEKTPKGLLIETPNVDVDDNVDDNVDANEKGTHPLITFLKKECPRVQKMKEPITHQQAEDLLANYPKAILADTFRAMQNYVKLTNNISANLTVRKWIAKDTNHQPKQQATTAVNMPPDL